MSKAPAKKHFTKTTLNRLYQARLKGATYDELASILKLKNRQAFYYHLKNNEELKQTIKDADNAKLQSLQSQTINLIQQRLQPQKRVKRTITDLYDSDGNLKGHQVKKTEYIEEPKSSEIIFVLEHLFKEFSKNNQQSENNEQKERRLINELNQYKGLD